MMPRRMSWVTLARFSVFSLLAVVLTAATALALDEVVVKIKKVDVDKHVLTIHWNRAERAVNLAADVKVLGADGKDLKDGLSARELSEGTEVTLSVERVSGELTIKAIRLGNQLAGDKPSVGLSRSMR